jgi:uncharacterized protein (DUF433 family)
MSTPVTSILERPTYVLPQVDRLLGLASGTARRWIEGYARSGKRYPPIVRPEATGEEVVSWGEFVETRLLAEYRDRGASIFHMRAAVEQLRAQFNTRYPLAHARPYVDVAGRELVMKVQTEVGLDKKLELVVVRNNQIVLADETANFYRSVTFSDQQEVMEMRPVTEIHEVVINPLRQFGEPVVRSVPTEVIGEQVRAGESIEAIAEIYELAREQVEAAVRYELVRSAA